MDLTIRKAERGDVASIVAMLTDDILGLTRENANNLGPYFEAFDAMEKEPHNNLYVACNSAGTVMGTFQLIYMQGLSLAASRRAEIEAVRVHSSVRGQGLGEQMFQWAIAKAKADGCHLLQLTTNKKRIAGQRFYDQLGFEASHVGYKMVLK